MSIIDPAKKATESVFPQAAAKTLGRTGWASLLDLTPYHWFVFVVAALGWLADCLDQQLFVLARENALAELTGVPRAIPALMAWEAMRPPSS